MSFSRILGVFLRYFYVSRKGLQQLADLFYWPSVDILLWGLASIWIQSQSTIHHLPLILMTGLVFWQIAWRGSVDIATSLLQEFWQRNLVNLFSTPLKFSEWIVGMLLFSLCKLAITVAFGSLLVFLLYTLNVFTVGWAFIPFAISLMIFGWALSFLSSSMIICWGHKVEMLAWMLGFIFAPFSSVFYPIEILPEWARVISWCLPTTYIFEGMRSLLHTGSYPELYFWTSLFLNLLFLASSIFLFHWAFEKSRQKGLARLE